MIFKDSNVIIFQSPFQANLFTECDDIFADGTFYIAPDFSYQVFITRTYVKALNIFYTTSFSILKNKKQSTYEKLFEEIKKNFNNYIIILNQKHFIVTSKKPFLIQQKNFSLYKYQILCQAL